MQPRMIVLGLLLCALGQAQISFHPAMSTPTQDGPVAMATADFNGDGKADLAISDTGSHVLAIWLGHGDGTFQQLATYPVASSCQMASLFVGDFTSDQQPDLLGICEFTTGALVFPGHADGTFGAAISTKLPALAYAGTLFLVGFGAHFGGTVGDFNGDGKLDIVVLGTNDLSGFPPGLITSYFLPGKGDGTFGTPVVIPLVDHAINIASADFNGDGKLDLAILTLKNDGENGDGVSILTQTIAIGLGNGDGTFRAGPVYNWNQATFALSAGDVNGDGLVDLYAVGLSLLMLDTAGEPTSPLTVMLGDGQGNFKAPVTVNDPLGTVAINGCLGDFTGTGVLDLVETSGALSAAGGISVGARASDGKGGFGALKTFSGPAGAFPFASVCADFNGDGLPDVAYTGVPMGELLGLISGLTQIADLGAALARVSGGELYVSLNASPALARTFGITNAASFASGSLAVDSIASAFWSGPANASGIGVNLKDSEGQTWPAQIFFSSPTQINFWIPAEMALGQATVNITGAPNPFAEPLQISAVAPGLFNVNQVALGYADTVGPNQTQTYTNVSTSDTAGVFHPVPIDVSAGNVFLLLFGTGMRNHGSAVTATFGSATLPVGFAGAQGTFVGEDQINIALPASLAGAGLVNVTLSVDGLASNSVQIQIK